MYLIRSKCCDVASFCCGCGGCCCCCWGCCWWCLGGIAAGLLPFIVDICCLPLWTMKKKQGHSIIARTMSHLLPLSHPTYRYTHIPAPTANKYNPAPICFFTFSVARKKQQLAWESIQYLILFIPASSSEWRTGRGDEERGGDTVHDTGDRRLPYPQVSKPRLYQARVRATRSAATVKPCITYTYI